jgi:hypothetical protein
MIVLAVAPAAIIVILAVVLIVAAIVVFLLAVIVELVKISKGLDVVLPPVAEIVAKTAPVNQLVDQINGDLIAGTNLLEGLLVKKAGLADAGGLIEGMFPGGGQAFFARNGRRDKPRRIGVVYTRGALQLARLGRGSPIGRAMRGSALRDPLYASASPRTLYPDPRGEGQRPVSPVVGKDSPVQYNPSGDIPMPATPVAEPQAATTVARPTQDTGGILRYRRP